MARVTLTVAGNSRGAVSAVKQVIAATGDLKEAAKTSATESIAARAKEREALERLATEYRAAAAAAVKGSKEQVAAIELARNAERQLGVETQRQAGFLGLFSRQTSGATNETGRFVRGALAGSGAAKALGRQVAFASGSFIGAAGLVGALISTANAAGDLETELNTFQAVTKATGGELDTARKKAVALGNDLSIPNASAADAAQAMTELAKGGLDVKESMEAAKGTLQLAAAAQTDNATAATIVARALNAFSLQGRDAVKVADLLAGAANASTGDMTDFALGLSQAGAQAHLAGLTIDETVTALAELANAGIVGSDAGTSLRVMLQRLNPTSKQAKELIQQLGLSVYDAKGQMLPLRDIVEKYSGVLDKLNPKQKAYVLNTIFGQDASRAAAIVLGGETQAYDHLNQAVTRHGQAAQLAGARTKGYNGAVAALKNAVQTLQIEIGTELLPTLTANIKSLANWVSHLNDGGRAVKDVDRFVGGLKTVLHDAKTAVDAVDKATGGFKRTLELLLALKVASVLRGWGGSLATLVGEESGAGLAGASARSKGLLTNMRALAKMGALTVGVDVFFRGTGDKGVQGIVERIVGGALVGGAIGGPTGAGIGAAAGAASAAGQAFPGAHEAPFKSMSSMPAAVQPVATVNRVLNQASRLGVGSGGVYETAGGHSGVATPGTMLDCSGYVYQVFTQAGFEGFPGTSETQWSTQSGPNWTSFEELVDDAQPGDVVFMVGSPKYPSPGHVGIVVSGQGSGAVIAEYYESGKPPRASRRLGDIGDLVGIKRFYLVKRPVFPTPAKPSAPASSAAAAAAGGGKLGAAVDAAMALKTKKSGSSKVKIPKVSAAIQSALGQASGTAGLADDIKANQEAVDYLTGLLDKTTNADVKAGLETAIGRYKKAITEARKKLATAAAKETGRENQAAGIRTALGAARTPLSQAFNLDLLPKSEEDKLKSQESKLAQIIRKAEADGKIRPAELSKIKASWKAMSSGISDATQAVAQHAKDTFDRAWQGVTTTITRALDEQWQITVRDFNRQTQTGIDAIQKSASDDITRMQRDFQTQLTQFDRETQAGLDAISAKYDAPTPTEALITQLQAQHDAQAQQDQLAADRAAGDTKAVAEDLYQIQLAALQKQADAERTAANAAKQQAQDAYQDQRDQLRQSLQDQETAREQARQTQADNDAQAYQDQRDAQLQHLQDMHDDQMTALNNDLSDWQLWLSNKQKSYAAFLAWLAQNPVSAAVAGQAPTSFSGFDTSPIAPSVGGAPSGALAAQRYAAAHISRLGFAGGGTVPGRYIGMDDTLIARVTPGEEVVDRSTAKLLRAFLAGGGVTVVAGDVMLDRRKVGTIVARPVTAAQRRQIGYPHLRA